MLDEPVPNMLLANVSRAVARPWARAGGTQRLPRVVGRTRAKELVFTGRRISAAQAVDYGLPSSHIALLQHLGACSAATPVAAACGVPIGLASVLCFGTE